MRELYQWDEYWAYKAELEGAARDAATRRPNNPQRRQPRA